MPAGNTHLRFGQDKPKPERKNQATGNTYRPYPSINAPIENWILVHSGLRPRGEETQWPLHFGILIIG